MRARFTQSFKVQAVEKALSRSDNVSVQDIADSLGVGFSTLHSWIRRSRNHEFEIASEDEIRVMTKDKRPQDWSLEERLDMVISCASLNDKEINQRCRKEGLYPHHIKQWRLDFVNGNAQSSPVKPSSDTKSLKSENKVLKKELNRKDKALAETAALLVLQKKVNAIWGSDEDNSQ